MRISIIIPCYDCERTLEEAVASCFAQGFAESEFEIVMVDDGSSDTTREVMRKLAEHHPSIKLAFHEHNRGGGAARNTAVSLTSSPVIFCLDSDDMLPPHTLDTMLAFLENKSCDGVAIHTSIKFRGSDANTIDRIDDFGYAGERIPLDSLLSRTSMCPLDCNFMYTRRAFDLARGYPENHGFDTQGFGWRFLCSGLIAYTCPKASYLHRVNFNQSYYLREANAGKINYNWQDIFLEHIDIFDPDTADFIRTFDCRDFTRSIHDEVKSRECIFKKDAEKLLSPQKSYPERMSTPRRYVPRNSLRGFYYRLRNMLH